MKRFKKALALILSLSMLTSLGLQSVLAEGASDRYEEVVNVQSIVDDAEVHVYSTKNAGIVELTATNAVSSTFPQGSGYREYKATPNENWVWKGWRFEQLFKGNDLGNRTDFGWGKRYSFSNSGSDWGTAYDGTSATISVNRLLTAGETVFSKITYRLYADFNPTINAIASDGGSITDAGVTEIEYGASKLYTVTADEGNQIASVLLDGVPVLSKPTDQPFNINFDSVTEPHRIEAVFEQASHTVSYAFESAVDGMPLPEEVTALLPASATVAHGTVVNAAAPEKTVIELTEGIWTFEGYDLTEATVNEDVLFTGTWNYEEKPEIVNTIPVINAADRTLYVGDVFEPMQGVSANDAEDGDLTASVVVIGNDVDTTKPGFYTVTYQVTDTAGASVTKMITVTVEEKVIAENHAPVIHAKDRTLYVGEEFDPMRGVSATDKEDGDLTERIEISFNDVDTSKPGTYSVIYEVSDNNQASSEKQITVKVYKKIVEPEVKPVNPPMDRVPDTADHSAFGLWLMMGMVSLIAAGFLFHKRNELNR